MEKVVGFTTKKVRSSGVVLVLKCFHDITDSPKHIHVMNDCPGSSVSIAIDYGLDGPGIQSRWGEIFRPSRQAHAASCTMGTGSSRGKVRPERDADHSPPSSAMVMEE